MSKVRQNIFFSIAERYAGFVINLVSMIVLSRLLTPAETGLYSIAAALVNIAQTLRNFGVYAYILQEKDLTDEKIGSAAGISLIVASVLAGFFILAARPVAVFYDAPELTPLIVVLSTNFLIVAYSAIGHGILIRTMDFRSNMVIATASAGANAAVSTSLAALGFGAACLAWGSLAGVATALIGNIVVLGRKAVARPNLRHWRAIFHFGVFSSASGLLGELSARTPDLLIGRLVSLEGAGLFSRGNGLVNALGSLGTGAAQPVISGLFAKTHREDANLSDIYLQASGYVCIIIWPAFGILAVLARPVIELCFGAQWLSSVPVAQALCAGGAVGLIGTLGQTLLRSIGAVRQNFFIQVATVPVYIVAVALGATIGLTAAAIGSVISGTIVSTLSVVVLRRCISLRLKDFAIVLWPALTATVASVTAAFAVVGIFGPSMRTLLPAGLLAGLAWLASVHLLNHPIRGEVRLVMGRVLRRGRSAKSKKSADGDAKRWRAGA